MPKVKRTKTSQSESGQGYMQSLVALILNSRLKEYKPRAVRNYLRMYSPECHGLNSKAIYNRARSVIRHIERSRANEQPVVDEPEPVVDEPEPVVDESSSPYSKDFLRSLDEKPFVALNVANWQQFEVTPMHWLHPIPYLFRIPADDEYQEALGHDADEVHPGEPPHEPFPDSPPLTFDHRSLVAYDRRLPHFIPTDRVARVIDISPKIYRLNPNRQPDVKSSRLPRLARGKPDKDKSIALIARALLSTGVFVCVLPVRLKHESTTPRVSCHYGLVLTYASGKNAILPLSVWFLGAQSRPTYKTKQKMKHYAAKQWMEECPGLETLLDKFEDCPIVRCEDVRVANQGSQFTPVHAWCRRRYATTWGIAHSLSSVRDSAAFPSTVLEGLETDLYCWDQYSDIKLFAQKISNVVPYVQFHGDTPVEPFGYVAMNAFDFISSPQASIAAPSHIDGNEPPASDEIVRNVEFEDPVIETLLDEEEQPRMQGRRDRVLMSRRGRPVDGKRTCVYHLECSLHPQPGSIFCLWHHRIVAHQRPQCFVNTLDYESIRRLATRQDSVTFRGPQLVTQWTAFRSLHNLAKNYVVWLVDVEFFVVPKYMVVPWQIVVRDGSSGAIVVSSLVDYNSMSIIEMVDELHKHDVNQHDNQCTYSKVGKRYQGPCTNGLSLGAIGKALLDAGFHADTHRVLSWYSPMDMQVFDRAINNESELLILKKNEATYRQIYDAKGQPCLQPVNLGPIVKQCTDLQMCALGYVYRSFFPGKYLDMHDAENDTLALYEVYNYFLGKTQSW